MVVYASFPPSFPTLLDISCLPWTLCLVRHYLNMPRKSRGELLKMSRWQRLLRHIRLSSKNQQALAKGSIQLQSNFTLAIVLHISAHFQPSRGGVGGCVHR